MKTIDLHTWPRRSWFEFYCDYIDPRSSAMVEVDVTLLRAACRTANVSFYLATLFAVQEATNAVPELRQRIRGRAIVEHEQVGVTFTTIGHDQQFNFVRLPHTATFEAFQEAARRGAAQVREATAIEPDPASDDRIHTSCFPWQTLRGHMPPFGGHELASIPEVVWSKAFDKGNQCLINVNLITHHGLVDGLHIGTFFDRVQREVDALAEALVEAVKDTPPGQQDAVASPPPTSSRTDKSGPTVDGALLASVPLFAALPDEVRDALAESFVLEHRRQGEVVIRAGETGERFYVIVRGALGVFAPEDEGGQRWNTMGDADVFGEVALLADTPRTATVIAESDTTLLTLDRATFEALIDAHPDVRTSITTEAEERAGDLRALPPG